jgi:hypothetical protein
MITLLPLLLAATPASGDAEAVRRPATRLATATVTIVQAERITPTDVREAMAKPDRQLRQREQMPLVEFF